VAHVDTIVTKLWHELAHFWHSRHVMAQSCHRISNYASKKSILFFHYKKSAKYFCDNI